jgi:hypothetical protein
VQVRGLIEALSGLTRKTFPGDTSEIVALIVTICASYPEETLESIESILRDNDALARSPGVLPAIRDGFPVWSAFLESRPEVLGEVVLALIELFSPEDWASDSIRLPTLAMLEAQVSHVAASREQIASRFGFFAVENEMGSDLRNTISYR